MTTMMREKSKCAICKAVNEYSVITSTNTFGGGPDLDLRPAEMQRSTMGAWVQVCPNCGYVSANISDKHHVTKKWLQSENYLTCDGIDFASDLAKAFYRYYLINLEDKETEDAFFAILHCAWACDDKMDIENAKHCRELAIPLADELIAADFRNKDNLLVLKSDLMRRAGQFDELIEQYADVSFDDDLLDKILAFQIGKAKEKDDGCYRVEDAAR